jgi:hypothetical protein
MVPLYSPEKTAEKGGTGDGGCAENVELGADEISEEACCACKEGRNNP